MSGTQRTYLIRAAAFAVVFEALSMIIDLLVGAYPHQMGPITTLKATFTVGLPSLTQLLDPRHQITFAMSWTDPAFLLWTLSTTVLFAWVNGYFIALVARSAGDMPGTPVQNANRAFPKLLIWMIAQMGLTVLCMPLIMIGQFFGGLLAMALLLWFRYAFMFFEYSTVILETGFVETLDQCRVIRRHVREEAFKYFWGIVIFDFVVALLVNGLFSLGAVLIFLPLNAIIMTLTQHNLVRIFKNAAQ